MDRVAAVHLPTIYEFAETLEEGGFTPRYGCFLTGPRFSVSTTGKNGHPRKVAQLTLGKQAHVRSPPLHLRLKRGFRLRR
jgi:hypothetical protein